MNKLWGWFMISFIHRYRVYKEELKRKSDLEEMRKQQEEIDRVLGYKSDD